MTNDDFHPETVAKLAAWSKAQSLTPHLASLQEALSTRLEAAGFANRDNWQVDCRLTTDGELLKTLAVRHYSQPDGEVSFFVEAAMYVFVGFDLGKSTLFARAYTPADEPGREGNLSFMTSRQLTRMADFESAKAWEAALQSAWASVEPEWTERLADQLVDEVERVTTP